jgi:hypothetical protein
MDLSIIGPNRREITRLSRVWLTVADVAGLAVGGAVAVVAILLFVA